MQINSHWREGKLTACKVTYYCLWDCKLKQSDTGEEKGRTQWEEIKQKASQCRSSFLKAMPDLGPQSKPLSISDNLLMFKPWDLNLFLPSVIPTISYYNINSHSYNFFGINNPSIQILQLPKVLSSDNVPTLIVSFSFSPKQFCLSTLSSWTSVLQRLWAVSSLLINVTESASWKVIPPKGKEQDSISGTHQALPVVINKFIAFSVNGTLMQPIILFTSCHWLLHLFIHGLFSFILSVLSVPPQTFHHWFLIFTVNILFSSIVLHKNEIQ